MSEQKIKLQNNEGISTNLSLSAPDGKAIIVQPAQRFEDRLANTVLDQDGKAVIVQPATAQDIILTKVADHVLASTSSVALGVFLTCGASIAIAHWLQVPEALKAFIKNQKDLADGVSKLAETVGDLAESQKTANQRIEKIEDALDEVKFEVKSIKEKIQ